MQQPEYLDELIDRAIEKAGSGRKLAAMLDVKPPAISQWKNGTKPCPPADQALMASIAGLEAEKFAAMALIAQHQGTAKGEKLLLALGKALLVTGAAIVSSGASAASATFSTGSEALGYLIRCIETLSKKTVRRKVKKANKGTRKKAGFFSSEL